MPVSYFPTIYNTHHATDDGVEMWQKEESTILWINWGENLKSKRLGGEPENHSSKKTELLLTAVKPGGENSEIRMTGTAPAGKLL